MSKQERMLKIPIVPLHSKFRSKYGSDLQQLQWEFKLFPARPGEGCGSPCLDSLFTNNGGNLGWMSNVHNAKSPSRRSLISLLAERAKLYI